jgi:predicted TIM-barrel fold metal-dependent hydrolase
MPRPPRLEDVLVVDCDVHLHETPEDLAPYCDMPWRIALQAIAGKDTAESYLDVPGLSPSGSAFEAKFPSTGHERHRVVTDAEQMRRELAALGIDIGILFPDNLLFLPLLTQPEYAAAVARAYNSWLVDRWCVPELGLLGCVVACPQDPLDAAREIERYARHPGVVAVYLPSIAVDPLWGNRRYDPIYAAAEAGDLAVMFHSGNVTHPVYPFNNHGFDTTLARHGLSHPFSIMANLTHMVTSGVPVRFPRLRIGVTEAGISWVPFLMYRLDKEYQENRREVPFLTEPPSAYLSRWYYSTQPIEEPADLRKVAALVDLYDGRTQTVFASDWPHHDFDHPRQLLRVPFAEGVHERILGLNALELFKIDENARRLDFRPLAAPA